MLGARGSAWRWTGFAAAGFVALAATVYGIGLLLPVRHTTTLSRHLDAPPDVVWSLVTDVERFPEWRPDVERVTLLEERDGLPTWREEGPGGALTFAVETWEPPRRLVTRIADAGLPFGGAWTYEVAPEDGGTRLTITEDGEVYPPLFRVVSRFVLGHERTLRHYLDAARARVESGAG